jgi:hypothetical protein
VRFASFSSNALRPRIHIKIPASHAALAELLGINLRLLGNHILNAVTGLFCTGLDTCSGVFGRDLGSMTNVFGPLLRGLADFVVACLTA